MTKILELLSNDYLISFISISFISIICSRIYPVIIDLGYQKNLMDEPVNRSMHERKTPTLGGIGVFITFSLTLILTVLLVDLEKVELLNLVAIFGSTIILLFTGIKDDLLDMSPKVKMLAQIIAATLVVVLTDVRIMSFDGLFGIYELPYSFSLLFSVLAFVFVINAFNLIDGIDGLAGSVGVLASISFGVFFVLNDNYLQALISFVLVGSLVGFLSYNLSKKNKLFLGDSGSLFIGFLLAYQAINFLVIPSLGLDYLANINKPVLACAVLVFPILDTLRVFIIRIYQGRSPFSADANHIHHRLLKLGFNHKNATASIVTSNVICILLVSLLGNLGVIQQLLGLIIITSVFIIGIFAFNTPALAVENEMVSSDRKVLSLDEEIIMSYEVLPRVSPSSHLVLVNDENYLIAKPNKMHKSFSKNNKANIGIKGKKIQKNILTKVASYYLIISILLLK